MEPLITGGGVVTVTPTSTLYVEFESDSGLGERTHVARDDQC